MTIREAHDIFFIVLDKYGVPGIETFEFSRLVNIAQDLFLQEFVKAYRRSQPSQGPQYGMEHIQQMTVMLQPLIHVVPAVAAGGIVSFTDLRSTLPNVTVRDELGPIETKPAEIMHILSVGRQIREAPFKVMCRYIEHNQWLMFINSYINKPTADNPGYRHIREGIEFAPADNANYEFSLLRHPAPVWYDPDGANNTDMEFSNAGAMYVIFRALGLAGVSLRETDFYQLVSNESQQQ